MNARRARIAAQTALVYIAARGMTGCIGACLNPGQPCATGDTNAVGQWHFEGADYPSSWPAGSGTAIVTSWNPGEHVLQIQAGSGTSAPVNSRAEMAGGMVLDLLVRCDPGATLWASAGGMSLVVSTAGSGWQHASQTFFQAQATYCLRDTVTLVVPDLGLQVSGSGACEVDDLDLLVYLLDCSNASPGCGNSCGGVDASADH